MNASYRSSVGVVEFVDVAGPIVVSSLVAGCDFRVSETVCSLAAASCCCAVRGVGIGRGAAGVVTAVGVIAGLAVPTFAEGGALVFC